MADNRLLWYPDHSLGRYWRWQTYRALNSPVTIVCLVLLLGAAAYCWQLAFVEGSQVMQGKALFLTGAGFLLGLLYAFARTYFPFLTAPQTFTKFRVSEGEEILDVSSVATWELVGILQSGITLPAKEGVALILPELLRQKTVHKILRRLQLPIKEVAENIHQLALPVLEWPDVWSQAVMIASTLQVDELAPEHIFAALMFDPTLQPFLRKHGLQQQDVSYVTWWCSSEARRRRQTSRWWDSENLVGFTGIGLAWTAGFTPLVDQFSRFPAGNIWDQVLVGRESEISQIITTLARGQQANVLVVGQPGVGRLGLVREVARRVRNNQAHPALNGERVVYVHMGEVLAQGTSNAKQLTVVSRVLNEMERAGNIIAVLDGLGSILAAAGESRLNLTDVLLPFFASLSIRVVVLISAEEYNLRIKANAELRPFFEVVAVDSTNEETTLQVVSLAVPLLEHRKHVFIPYRTIRALTTDVASILPDIPLPERAFDFLDEALVIAQAKHQSALEPADIEALISKKVKVPFGQLTAGESERLLGLEDVMHQTIVNQKRAVATVVHALIRARSGVRRTDRPIGTFLFLGPTGVGKTETAKTLASVYFGSTDYVSRLDMSEYQTEADVANLIGSAKRPVGRLATIMGERPFTVLLLDEFEKAHRSVQQLFLSVFDEGQLLDIRGQIIYFRHALIIATSNAGAEFIREHIIDGQVPEDFDNQLRDYILSKDIFRPELLNRFDSVVTFTPLSPDHVREVAVRLLKQLNERLDAVHGVTVEITPELVEYLFSIGYTPEFGARPMARAVQDAVEYAVAQQVLQNTVVPGQVITLHPQALQDQKV